MDNIRATIGALKGLVEVLAADPALYQRFKAERKKTEDDNGRDAFSITADRMIAKEPKLAAVYKRAGITPKVAGMTMETLAGVLIGSAMAESAGGKEVKLPVGFVADNSEFYKQKKTEILAAMDELKSMSGKIEVEDGDEEQEPAR